MDKQLKSKSQMAWLDLNALGFNLYERTSVNEKQFVLVANGSPVSPDTEKALLQGQFSKTDTGFIGKVGLRSSAVLNTLPGAKKITVFPDEIDHHALRKNQNFVEKDPMIGRKWNSSLGEREVIKSCKPDTKTLYWVKTQGQKHSDWYLATDLENIIALDQNPTTKWRAWEVINPHEWIKSSRDYEECHIFRKDIKNITRVAGKPVSFDGYENHGFFMAKIEGRWNVFEKTTGLSITGTNGVKTQKEATILAKETLKKHTGSAEKLSVHLQNVLKIPQPGQIELPPKKETEIILPSLRTYDDALAWIDQKAQEYGDKKKLYASDEYKAAYPTIERLHSQEKEDLILKARQTVADAGLSSGDSIFYLSPDKTFGLYGHLYFANTGMPRVKIHTEHSLLGGEVPSNKRMDWHEGWTRTNALDRETATSENPNEGSEPTL